MLLSAGMAWAALSEAPPEETERNRWLLGHLGHDRAHYARLLRDAREFHNLPPAARARIELLDREVQAETSTSQVRLLRAADRYAEWLRALPPEERARVEAETDKDKRLALIKEIRQRQWLDKLPAPLRERIDKASDRVTAIAHVRAEEQRWRQDWNLALQHWNDASANSLPDRAEKLPAEARDFVKETLWPRLHEDERLRLRIAEGSWPQYPRTLVDLADSERVAFRLLMPTTGTSKMDDLPKDFQKKLHQVKAPELTKKRLARLEGHYPDFALLVTEIARKSNIPMPRQLGPCFPRDYPKAQREFIHQKMQNFNTSALDKEERERLRSAEGFWPLYPRTVLELAKKHNLSIPGVSLPGPAGYWDVYRARPPSDDSTQVSDLVLRVFSQFELSDTERAEIGIALSDPLTRERLQQEYAKKHPDEWQKLVEADKQKRARKK